MKTEHLITVQNLITVVLHGLFYAYGMYVGYEKAKKKYRGF